MKRYPPRIKNKPKKSIYKSKNNNIDKRKYVLNFLNSLSKERPNSMDSSLALGTDNEKCDRVIAFVLKKSEEYDIDYLEHIINSLKKYVNSNVEYVCLSDINVEKYCTWIKFENDWPGWWSKLELFSHPYLRNKNVTYFDLDVIIKDDITPLINYDVEFAMLKGFSNYKKSNKVAKVNSSIMKWNTDLKYISDAFDEKKHIKEYRSWGKWGDQDFIHHNINKPIKMLQDIFPKMVCSKKYNKNTLDQCKIICFHGKPRPRDVNWNWMH